MFALPLQVTSTGVAERAGGADGGVLGAGRRVTETGSTQRGLTALSDVAGRTVTDVVFGLEVVTEAAIVAGGSVAWLSCSLAVCAAETVPAVTQVAVHTVNTGASIETRSRQTVVCVILAVIAGEASTTLTCVIFRLLHTHSTVFTGVPIATSTVRNIRAMRASPPLIARARDVIQSGCARGVSATERLLTVIVGDYLYLAGGSPETVETGTGVADTFIPAATSIDARTGDAMSDRNITVKSSKVIITLTPLLPLLYYAQARGARTEEARQLLLTSVAGVTLLT